ncbi:phage protein Gp36 family protein [Pseudomonas aeruginosa]
MSYCTLADLIEQYSEQKIRELSDRVNKPATTIDTVIVDRAIADADSEIDLHLHGRYQLPLASVPTALKRIACGLAYAESAHRSKGREPGLQNGRASAKAAVGHRQRQVRVWPWTLTASRRP